MTVMPVTIHYRFSHSFAVLPKQAYLWCTDFSTQDLKLLGYSNAERQVVQVSDDVVLLKDVFYAPSGGVVEKQKLVHLYPDRLSWVSTHIAGPNKHSQFCYEILVETCGCRLNYEALHVEHGKDSLTSDERSRLSDVLCRADLEVWRLLALVMEQELK
ncbi:MAG: hypothetical protein FWG55_07170 [Candidatus Bathyarchaeota archaeon]|nr:hypothetical protein [Candidatus Termiticorpusculum sp.]